MLEGWGRGGKGGGGGGVDAKVRFRVEDLGLGNKKS